MMYRNQIENTSYSLLFDGSTDLIFILSPNLQIQYANPTAEKFFKFSAAKTVHLFEKYLTSENRDRFYDALKMTRQALVQFRFEMRGFKRGHQDAQMDVTLLPLIKNKEIAAFYLNLRDISQERQIQELVNESQKMEALQYFVSGTTKEIQHPLLAILRRIETIQKHYEGKNFEYVGHKEFLNIFDSLKTIHEQIKACYETTARLTNLNKKRLKFESDHCEVNSVIREILRLREKNLRFENIGVRLKFDEPLPLVAIGELELNQIINHLIDNAVEAMPAGGQLVFTTSLSVGKQEVKIDIKDEGVGISSEDLPHIFEPFFTNQKKVNHGAGLGLSIVYSLVKASYGQIKVKSSQRKGTCFTLIFPVC